jgi:FlaA1/EpsC-like NDP-sugar epimerase
MGERQIIEWFAFPPVSVSHARLRRALAGKIVLITGASFGIGEEVARLSAAAGGPGDPGGAHRRQAGGAGD